MDLNLIRIFVKVVQNGSFSKAANLLKLPRSSVSKAVARLEKEIGATLLMRTTRHLTLTEAGQTLFHTTSEALYLLEDAYQSIDGQDKQVTGRVRITAPEDVGEHLMAPAIAQVMLHYPGLCIELYYTNEAIDLVKDGFDLAVRIGRINESSFKMHRVGKVRLLLVAAPSYLQRTPSLLQPDDLLQHDCLTYSNHLFQPRWTLTSATATIHLSIKARMANNHMTSLLHMAVAGGGIALLPHFLCLSAFSNGSLQHVLPEWCGPTLPVSLISPLASSSSARLKVTIEALVKVLQHALHE